MVYFSLLVLMASLAIAGAITLPWLPLGNQPHRRSANCNVQACIEPMAHLIDPIEGVNFDVIQDEEDIDDLCRKRDVMETCLRPIYHHCQGVDDRMARITVNTTVGLANYMCSAEARLVFQQEHSCLEDEVLDDEILECAAEFERQQRLGYRNYCTMMDEFGDCSVQAARRRCNGETAAVSFIENIGYYMLEPIAREMLGCHLQQPGSRDLM